MRGQVIDIAVSSVSEASVGQRRPSVGWSSRRAASPEQGSRLDLGGATMTVVGVPKEIKVGERRVALTPDGARTLRSRGARVCVERGAGEGSGFADDEYAAAGAQL